MKFTFVWKGMYIATYVAIFQNMYIHYVILCTYLSITCFITSCFSNTKITSKLRPASNHSMTMINSYIRTCAYSHIINFICMYGCMYTVLPTLSAFLTKSLVLLKRKQKFCNSDLKDKLP